MAKRTRWLLVLITTLAVAACGGGASVPGSTSIGRQIPLNGAAIAMVDARYGWAYSDRLIARTSDGAQTFHAVTPPRLPSGAQLDPPLFLDSMHAFAFAIVWDGSTLKTSVLERTSDGGATWQSTAMTPAAHGDLTFFDPQHGWLVSGQDSADHLSITNTLWRTTDGGSKWTSMYSYTYRVDVHPSVQSGGCYWQGSIAWSSPTHGIVGVACPFDAPLAVDVTDDGGSTWIRRNLPDLSPQTGMVLYSSVGPVHVFAGGAAVAEVGRCVGQDGSSCFPHEELYRSEDGGLTWTGGASIRAGGELIAIDSDHAWFSAGCLVVLDDCTTFGLLSTADGGVTWRVFPLRQELGPNMHGSRTYSFVTPDLGFAVASNEFVARSSYFKTTDGGMTFVSFTPGLVG